MRLLGVCCALLTCAGCLEAPMSYEVVQSPTVAISTGSGTAWSNADRICTYDPAEWPKLDVASVSYTTECQWLGASGYGFSIPAAARITGIKVSIFRQCELRGRRRDGNLVLLKAGESPSPGVPGVTDLADTGTLYPESPNGAYAHYGGDGELWGREWTAAEINSAGFGVAWKPDGYGGGRVDCDHIPVTVYYELDDTIDAVTISGAGLSVEQLIIKASTVLPVTVTKVAGGVGLVMGVSDATRLYRQCDSANTDGSAIARCIAMTDFDATEHNVEIPALFTGEVNEDALTFGGDDDVDDHRAELHDAGIFPRWKSVDY